MLERSILYQANKHSSENPSVQQVIEYSYKNYQVSMVKADMLKCIILTKNILII